MSPLVVYFACRHLERALVARLSLTPDAALRLRDLLAPRAPTERLMPLPAEMELTWYTYGFPPPLGDDIRNAAKHEHEVLVFATRGRPFEVCDPWDLPTALQTKFGDQQAEQIPDPAGSYLIRGDGEIVSLCGTAFDMGTVFVEIKLLITLITDYIDNYT